METITITFAGLYILGIPFWIVSKGWKITISLFQGKIELEPPTLPPADRE
ncbi:MAG: hypothetical protein AAFQ80_19115 [Cyanobacteria bacterium J06621_8]